MPKETPTPIRPKQATIPGTEPLVPPGILRQAHKVVELLDLAALATQRAQAAHDFLLSMMAKQEPPLARFVLDEPDMGTPLIFRIDQPDQKVKIDGYKKPELLDVSSAVG